MSNHFKDVWSGLTRENLMILSFLAYEERKRHNWFYPKNNEELRNLIKLYYTTRTQIDFNKIKKSFITKYVKNESKLEGVDINNIHDKTELDGLQKMYAYIHDGEISKENHDLSYFDLNTLHKLLFSLTKYSEYAGEYRTIQVYLPGTGTEICEYSMIRESLHFLDKEMIQPLAKIAKKIREIDINQEIPIEFIEEIEEIGGFKGEYSNKNSKFYKIDAMLAYLDAVVILGCKLIKIHPFVDGNGRTIRGFLNKMLEDVGFPPIYIKVKERTEYQTAMNLANRDPDYGPDYNAIKQFYYYKICDSIVELDINNQISAEYKPKKRS